MSCDRSADRSKWSCEYCTYDNYPSSKKCTLCRAPRQPQYIDRDDDPPTSHDIYKMAPLICPTSAGGGSGRSSPGTLPSVPPDTWACRMCTFINHARAANCAQCLTSRRQPSMSSVISATTPLSIDVNESSTDLSREDTQGSRTQRNSPNSPEAAKATNNVRNRAVLAADKVISTSGGGAPNAVDKWACKVCTYDNWPRSLKCVICGFTKSRSTEILVPSSSTAAAAEKVVKHFLNVQLHIYRIRIS